MSQTYIIPPHRRWNRAHMPAPGPIPGTKREYRICPVCTTLFDARLGSHIITCGAPRCVHARKRHNHRRWADANPVRKRELGRAYRRRRECDNVVHNVRPPCDPDWQAVRDRAQARNWHQNRTRRMRSIRRMWIL